MAATEAHVLMCLWRAGPLRKLLEKTTSTDKLEVEMLPHVAEGRVGVLIDDSAIQAKGKLPAPPIDVERLPH